MMRIRAFETFWTCLAFLIAATPARGTMISNGSYENDIGYAFDSIRTVDLQSHNWLHKRQSAAPNSICGYIDAGQLN